MNRNGLLSGETVFLFHSILLGAGLTLFYDFFEIARRLKKHKEFWIAVEDLCFWAICGVIIFLVLYQENNGTFRWFAVAGAGLGMCCYKKWISPVLVNLCYRVLSKVFRTILHILKWMFSPLRYIIRKGRKQLTHQLKMLNIGVRKK